MVTRKCCISEIGLGDPSGSTIVHITRFSHSGISSPADKFAARRSPMADRGDRTREVWGTPHHSGRRGSINQIRQKIVEASSSSLMHQNLLIDGEAGPINAADGGDMARLGPALQAAGKNAGPARASHDSRDLAAYTQHRQATHPTLVDDLSREVYCMLGIPVDDILMPSTVERIEAAIANKRPFLLSTPNLNFLINSQSDASFRELWSLVTSVLRTLCRCFGSAD